MNIKEIKFSYILLIPSVLLTSEYLPLWFIVYVSALLLILAVAKLPKLMVYLNFIPTVFVFESVGYNIIPETTVPILLLFILSNFIQNRLDSKSLDYLYFFWIGILSIFYSDLYYLMYAILCLSFLVYTQHSEFSAHPLGFFLKIKKNYKVISASFLLIVVLFIFFPRVHNFLPKSNYASNGKIGYSKSVNNSETSNIQLSSQNAFYAEVDKKMPNMTLYWRGRVNDITDGYNWSTSYKSHAKRITYKKGNIKTIETKLKYEQDFNGDLILLDTPHSITQSNLSFYHDKGANTYRSYSKNKKAIITASSMSLKNRYSYYSQKERNYLTKLPSFMPKALKEISQQVQAKSTHKIITNFRRYLLREKFSYTLSPGLMPTMASFIEKKKGYCTHFASLLAVILRSHDVPTRLVSGFQGGTYNDLGKYYIIKSNDAHVWVEYLENNRWTRIDPTSFVSPNRINLGGQQFFTNPTQETQNRNESNFLVRRYNYIKQYMENLNYKVSLFFDNFDKAKQEEISKKLKLNFMHFVLLGALLIVLLSILIYIMLRKKNKQQVHPSLVELKKLNRKLKGVKFDSKNTQYIAQIRHAIAQSQLTEDNKKQLLIIANEYQKSRYSKDSDSKKLQILIKNFRC